MIHEEQLNSRKIKLVDFISLFFGFSWSISIYIISFYFSRAMGSDQVGIFYFFAFLINLFLVLNLHKIIKKLNKSLTLILLLLIKASLAASLAYLSPSLAGAALIVFYIVATQAAWVALDAVLESFSTDRASGRIRGMYLTIMNIGFIFGPFISTRILNSFGFQATFLFVFIIDFLMFLFVLLGLGRANHETNRAGSIPELLKRAWERKDVLKIYYISFALEFFFAAMIVFTPIYLRGLGMSLKDIGVAFSFMLIPFVFLQYPAGFLADKKWGEKGGLIAALAIMGASTLAVFFISSKSVMVWALILFLTRVGAALIEVLRDSYFYKRIDGRDVDLIDFFRTPISMAYIIFSLLSLPVIYFFSVKAVFALAAAVVLSALWPAWRLENNRAEK